MNEQRLFEMTSQTNLKGHVAKSIAPFQLRISIHRIIERKIRENCSPYIYNYVMLKVICQQLLTDW